LMGVLLALIYTNIGWWGVVIAGLPLIANYHALRYISLLRQSYTQIVQALGDILDLREHGTAGHSLRIGALARRLGEEMGLPRSELDHLYVGGVLHDIGKIAMEDAILLGSGNLSMAEWEKVRLHPVLGSRLLEAYPQLQRAAAIVRHHHERFDGTGYPDGLKGREIPIGARIVSVVDSFDAMYFGRPYRASRSWDDACEELQRCAGTQFDPAAVKAFLRIGQRQVLAAIPPNALPEAVVHAH
ncbi:MAG: HD-GYP domain-containing protein, partial [Chloroflexi bacterium]|nr:HD-GYP domain-containing protein [Chloroflexota bacterium]